MTFLDPNNPSQSELEALRVECAKEAGWEHPHKIGVTWREYDDLMPKYSTSYDAIMLEIQKLDLGSLSEFDYELKSVRRSCRGGGLYLDAKPWELALAWLRVKQQNKKEV